MAKPSEPSRSVPILIISDRQIVRTGLEMMFRTVSDFEVVDQGDFATLPALRHRSSSAVTVLEFCGSDSALPIVGKLMRSDPECSAMLLATNENPSFVRSILATGVKGYVLKTANTSELYDAVRHVHAGHRYVDPRLSDVLADMLLTPRARYRKPSLSKRELEVLRAVAYGFTSKQIAEELGITEKTVCTYRSRVCEKLHLRGRSDLVQYAITADLRKDAK